MRRNMLPLLLLTAVVTAVPTLGARVVESRKISQTIEADGAAPLTVCVDNIFGPILVVGHDRPTVEIEAEETVRARSQAAFDRARAEISLEIGREGDEVTAIVDGPFRDRKERGWCCDDAWEGYTVTYEFVLRVPRRSDLELKTVNDGDIRVENVHGEFRVANVNGSVYLDGMTGPGDATTVNGPIEVRFDSNPDGDSKFHTVNGDLELWFQRGLSADLHFKTFNGDAFTDFEVEPLPTLAPTKETKNGRRVIRSDRWSSVRVDRGGPQLRFETLNGDILIRNAR